MNELPNDVLVIHYIDLAPDSARRLRLLSAIGALLGQPASFHTPAALELSPDAWLCLRTWIEQGHGRQFWRLESQGVHVIRSCEKHILIGTSQLLPDLRDVIRKPLSVQQPRLDEVWVAARRYVTTEITREAD